VNLAATPDLAAPSVSGASFHLRHGPHEPLRTTPQRLPGTIRRTTSIDASWPFGLDLDLILRGTARDIRTVGSSADVLGTSAFEMSVDWSAGRVVRAVTTEPHVPEALGLTGARAASGFRARLDDSMRDAPDSWSLLYRLLDDVPGATLLSGYALRISGRQDASAGPPIGWVADLCSGFQAGGTVMVSVADSGRSPMVTGPEAPSLEQSDDDEAWHAMPAMAVNSMRRRRLIDVARASEELIVARSIFRDSYLSAEGGESVIHEYELTAEIEPTDWRITRAAATPRVLPWLECPPAADSAQRLVGRTLNDLRPLIRAEFRGVSTCTHLNDQMRSLTDVVALAKHLPDAGSCAVG